MNPKISTWLVICLLSFLASPAAAQFREVWDWTAQVPACDYYDQQEVTCTGSIRTRSFSTLLERYDIEFATFLEWNNLPASTQISDSARANHFYMVRDAPAYVDEGNVRTYHDGLIFTTWSMICFEKGPTGVCHGTLADVPLSQFPSASGVSLERLDELNELVDITSWDQILPANTFMKIP